MKISVVIPYWECDLDKRGVLKKCLHSFGGQADETIIVQDIDHESRGPTRATNQGFAISSGDYIIAMADDVFLNEGQLKDLCVPDTITSPKINGVPQDFWGMVWCTPRNLYEKYGCLDEIYDGGIYFDDTDKVEQIKALDISNHCVTSVDFQHPVGGRSVYKDAKRSDKYKRNKKLFEKKWPNAVV